MQGLILLALFALFLLEWPRMMDALEDDEPDYQPPWREGSEYGARGPHL